MDRDAEDLLATLEATRAKVAAICAALPDVDWESEDRVCAWLDAKHQAMGRRKIALKQHPKTGDAP